MVSSYLSSAVPLPAKNRIAAFLCKILLPPFTKLDVCIVVFLTFTALTPAGPYAPP